MKQTQRLRIIIDGLVFYTIYREVKYCAYPVRAIVELLRDHPISNSISTTINSHNCQACKLA